MKTEMEGPKFSKRKKLGRNKKKSWRGIDISKTEDFLEDQRFQLRTTGLVAEKSDSQLFSLERGGTEKSGENRVPEREPRELRCYSNLKNTSRISCPRKEYPSGRNVEGSAVQREVCSLRAVKRKALRESAKGVKPDAASQQAGNMKDLWGAAEQTETGDGFFNEVTKRKRVQPPKHIKRKVSARPAVEVPHPGASVNPSYDDHQVLLLDALVVEEKKSKEEKKLYNALDAQFPRGSEAPTEATWLEEMSAGLFTEKVKEENEAEGLNDGISINPPVNREKKKTPRDKRKKMAEKLLKHQVSEKKAKKEAEQKVYSVAKIRSQLAQEERKKTRRAQLRTRKQEEKKFAPKKLGKIKVAAPDLELKLSSELVGSLRCVKPEGHLLEDRFKSFQMRNIMEPRVKVNKKKTKKKVFEKKSFREVTV